MIAGDGKSGNRDPRNPTLPRLTECDSCSDKNKNKKDGVVDHQPIVAFRCGTNNGAPRGLVNISAR